MGKAAKNEAIKLAATFFNNLSVGLFLAGVFIPYLGFIQAGGGREIEVFAGGLAAGHLAPLTDRQGLAVFAFVLAMGSSWVLRQAARTTIRKIED
jgi:hypothetical protein